MNAEELTALLKEKLTVDVSMSDDVGSYGEGGRRLTVRVTIMLGGEKVASSADFVCLDGPGGT